jgi:ubiquinone/menaquinone biosynthesis C-methylase UbiE
MAEDMALQAMHLPPPPATVADIGGGPGRYALWLADLVCVEGRRFCLMISGRAWPTRRTAG